MPPLSSNYQEVLAWLYGTQLFGIKLGLEPIRRLLRELDVPGKEQRFVHVAGTNGKGSVCAMIAAICRAHGYRTGLFTSPHLVTYRERIQVDGQMIPSEKVVDGLNRIRKMVADWDPHPTFFEITTALALVHFQERACEVIALETGLGGRLDSTNAVTPVVSVITPIGYDHQKWLGNTLEEIAGEKAGIIKAHVPVVSASQEPAAAMVIQSRAAECDAPLRMIDQPYSSTSIALAGAHQQQNAALAIAALRAGKIQIDESAITRGLHSVEWPARFQRWDERTIIDGAHNPAGAKTLLHTWRENFGEERATLVLSILSDKDLPGICQALAPIADYLVFPKIHSQRSVAPEILAELFTTIAPRLRHSITRSIADAMIVARDRPNRVLLTGSLHFAGEALALLRGDAAAFEECAQ